MITTGSAVPYTNASHHRVLHICKKEDARGRKVAALSEISVTMIEEI